MLRNLLNRISSIVKNFINLFNPIWNIIKIITTIGILCILLWIRKAILKKLMMVPTIGKEFLTN